jgi:Nucleolar protein 11 C-terminal domain
MSALQALKNPMGEAAIAISCADGSTLVQTTANAVHILKDTATIQSFELDDTLSFATAASYTHKKQYLVATTGIRTLIAWDGSVQIDSSSSSSSSSTPSTSPSPIQLSTAAHATRTFTTDIVSNHVLTHNTSQAVYVVVVLQGGTVHVLDTNLQTICSTVPASTLSASTTTATTATPASRKRKSKAKTASADTKSFEVLRTSISPTYSTAEQNSATHILFAASADAMLFYGIRVTASGQASIQVVTERPIPSTYTIGSASYSAPVACAFSAESSTLTVLCADRSLNVWAFGAPSSNAAQFSANRLRLRPTLRLQRTLSMNTSSGADICIIGPDTVAIALVQSAEKSDSKIDNVVVSIWETKYGTLHGSAETHCKFQVQSSMGGNTSTKKRRKTTSAKTNASMVGTLKNAVVAVGSKVFVRTGTTDGIAVLRTHPIAQRPVSLGDVLGAMNATQMLLDDSAATGVVEPAADVTASSWVSNEIQSRQQLRSKCADVEDAASFEKIFQDPIASSEPKLCAALRKLIDRHQHELKTASSSRRRYVALPQAFVRRMAAHALEHSFWKVLRLLVNASVVAYNDVPTLIHKALTNGRADLALSALKGMRDIPETDLAVLLQHTLKRMRRRPKNAEKHLQSVENSLQNALSWLAERTALQAESNPLAAHVSEAAERAVRMFAAEDLPAERYLHQIMHVPVNDIFLHSALSALSIEDVELMLRFCYKWASRHIEFSGSVMRYAASSLQTSYASLNQVIDWISTLIDAHFVKLVLRRESYSLLTELYHVIANQHVPLCSSIESLRGIVAHCLKRRDLPRPPMSDYAIEVIHL